MNALLPVSGLSIRLTAALPLSVCVKYQKGTFTVPFLSYFNTRLV
jgi:hypothetical protein